LQDILGKREEARAKTELERDRLTEERRAREQAAAQARWEAEQKTRGAERVEDAAARTKERQENAAQRATERGEDAGWRYAEDVDEALEADRRRQEARALKEQDAMLAAEAKKEAAAKTLRQRQADALDREYQLDPRQRSMLSTWVETADRQLYDKATARLTPVADVKAKQEVITKAEDERKKAADVYFAHRPTALKDVSALVRWYRTGNDEDWKRAIGKVGTPASGGSPASAPLTPEGGAPNLAPVTEGPTETPWMNSYPRNRVYPEDAEAALWEMKNKYQGAGGLSPFSAGGIYTERGGARGDLPIIGEVGAAVQAVRNLNKPIHIGGRPVTKRGRK